jgi:hypothetical protein
MSDESEMIVPTTSEAGVTDEMHYQGYKWKSNPPNTGSSRTPKELGQAAAPPLRTGAICQK